MSYDHWKTTNPADEFLGPEPEDCQLQALKVEYDRRDAYLNNVRKAIRYQALANEMSDVFQEWLMPVQDQFTLSNYIAMLNIRAAKLMEPRHET